MPQHRRIRIGTPPLSAPPPQALTPSHPEAGDLPPRVQKMRPQERKRVESIAAPRAIVIHEAIRKEGEQELSRPASSLLLSALAAGLSMGFSMVGMGLMQAHLPVGAEWTPLVASFGYSLGFLIVILGRQQLFTENTLTAVLPLLHRRNLSTLAAVARLWGLVLAANLVDTLLFAAGAVWLEVFSADARAEFLQLGVHAANPETGIGADGGARAVFFKAVVAGWLIALLVWILPLSEGARPFIVLIVTWLVAVADLSHIVAGSAEVAYAAMQGAVGWDTYLFGFVLPCLAGNIVGGVVLVAIVHHGQVRAEAPAEG